MEGIFGPAESRDDSPEKFSLGDPPQTRSMPNLTMNWPGLLVKAYYDTLHENNYIDIVFSEEFLNK